jgi:hypothetical protein
MLVQGARGSGQVRPLVSRSCSTARLKATRRPGHVQNYTGRYTFVPAAPALALASTSRLLLAERGDRPRQRPRPSRSVERRPAFGRPPRLVALDPVAKEAQPRQFTYSRYAVTTAVDGGAIDGVQRRLADTGGLRAGAGGVVAGGDSSSIGLTRASGVFAPHRPGLTGCPILLSALSAVGCRVTGNLPAGDSTLFRGRGRPRRSAPRQHRAQQRRQPPPQRVEQERRRGALRAPRAARSRGMRGGGSAGPPPPLKPAAYRSATRT